jgi:thiamine-phosphate pyrophosphorylase
MFAMQLCLVTDKKNQSLGSYQQFILKAIQGGVTAVQLREKHRGLDELGELALALQSILKPLQIPLIINDHVPLAKAIDADGVHLGQQDLSPVVAREILGPDKIIGWSIETVSELEEANQLDCLDYVAISAVFPSKSKTNCKTIWGIEGLKSATQKSRYPIVAIGGINAANIKSVFESGAAGAAVISAIHEANDPKQAAADLIYKMRWS